MKKFLFGVVFALCGLTAMADSTVCALDDKNTVEIQFALLDVEKSEVTVMVGSDAPYPANVTVTVMAKYECANVIGSGRYETREYSGRGLAMKETTTQIQFRVPATITKGTQVYNIMSVEAKAIKGRKCQ